MIIARLLFPSPGRLTATKSTRSKEPTPSSHQPADGRFLAHQIPGAKYVELNAAHLSNIEDQDRFTTELAAFLNS
jgi:hypothetical protein